MTIHDLITLPGYDAAINQTAFYPQTAAGYVRISGADRQDFLQRQSTNDVRLLSPTRVVTTVLTTATARILDVLTLVEEPESIEAITLPGRAEATVRFLKGKIFFMDKVSVDDASSEMAQINLIGPEASQVLESIGLSRLPSGDELVVGEISGNPAKVFSQHGLGYRLLIPVESSKQLVNSLKEAGATGLSSEVYNVLRVEMGFPEAGHELTEEYTPLETGLGWAISGDKGCYTGQEVIARQITYDKVTRQLVGLKPTAEVKAGERIAPHGESKTVGGVTSSANSPRFGHISLAVIRKPYHKPGTEVIIGDEGEGVSATVTSLPFS